MASLLGKYKKFPITLYRLQQSKEAKLRDMHSQFNKGKRSFDFVLNKDGLVHPNKTNDFIGPNGMSLRPIGKPLIEIEKSYKYTHIYQIMEGAEIPEELILVHEYKDHYSLQTSVVCTPLELNNRLSNFLYKQKSLTKEEFIKLLRV